MDHGRHGGDEEGCQKPQAGPGKKGGGSEHMLVLALTEPNCNATQTG
jgi:hypothetical protein